jgi:AcrR family transcriptional regulator
MARRGARTAGSGAAAAELAPPADGGAAATTRERTLDAALDLFIRKGYAETSLREIAAELGFSKAALYYHFESKQDILLALHMRIHRLTEEVVPLLQVDAEPGEVWERLIDLLIRIALQNRRLMELHLRNQEAMAELHQPASLKKHGAVQHAMDEHLLSLIRDPTAPAEQRVRRVASLGAIGGVLLGAQALADVPDAELETALRAIVHDVLDGRPG